VVDLHRLLQDRRDEYELMLWRMSDRSLLLLAGGDAVLRSRWKFEMVRNELRRRKVGLVEVDRATRFSRLSLRWFRYAEYRKEKKNVW